MRFWFGGPRILGVRTGVSFGPEDFRKRERAYHASASPKPETGSFVYVIAGDHNLIKIGVSSNPNARMAQLRTSSPFNLRFVLIGAVNGDAYRIEAAAHEMLARQRLEGEWFDVTPELAMSAVTGAAAKTGLKLQPVDPAMVDTVIQVAQATEAQANQPHPKWWPIWVSLPLMVIAWVPFWLLMDRDLIFVSIPYMAVICVLAAAPIILNRRPGSSFRKLTRWGLSLIVGAIIAGIAVAIAMTKPHT